MGSTVTGDLLLKAILLLSLQTSTLLFSTEPKRTLSKDEYLSMKRHLKSLNKPQYKASRLKYYLQMKPGSHPQRKGILIRFPQLRFILDSLVMVARLMAITTQAATILCSWVLYSLLGNYLRYI
ncbi:hypothetical protein H6P81_020997 [Aristolochia fimbriata]|uniref:Uncharacterized protein n=1 Tax=Aristolochia fimbriata TaxID=158543 RepID=A0AAV7E0D8_ARIFI|nr:hypothetical protein H6P81_020997 [Aristolochia fimbriata]